MNELVKAFNHIVRDILVYMLPGAVLIAFSLFVLVNFGVIANWYMFLTPLNVSIALFFSYIIGQIVFAFMEFFFVFIPVEDKVQNIIISIDLLNNNQIKNTKDFNAVLNRIKSNARLKRKQQITIFRLKGLYDFFVERHVQLSLFRWNLSGVFYLIFLFSVVMTVCCTSCFYLGVSLISLLLFIILFYFSIKTDLDGAEYRELIFAKRKEFSTENSSSKEE